jgi:FkbM family methyltransferase
MEHHFGWSGIAIDALEYSINEFKNKRICTAVRAALSNVSGEEVQFVKGGGTTGILDDTCNDHVSANFDKGNPVFTLTTITLTDLLAQHNCPKDIDYLDIDLEGHDCKVLSGLDLDYYNVKCICIETLTPEMKQNLLNLGYKIVVTTPDTIFVKG